MSEALFMDKFAENAVVFDNHYATATSTLMNLYSSYTGLHPRQQPILSLKSATIPIHQIPKNLSSAPHSNGYDLWTSMQKHAGNPKICVKLYTCVPKSA